MRTTILRTKKPCSRVKYLLVQKAMLWWHTATLKCAALLVS